MSPRPSLFHLRSAAGARRRCRPGRPDRRAARLGPRRRRRSSGGGGIVPEPGLLFLPAGQRQPYQAEPTARRPGAEFRGHLLGQSRLEGHLRQPAIYRAPVGLRPRAAPRQRLHAPGGGQWPPRRRGRRAGRDRTVDAAGRAAGRRAGGDHRRRRGHGRRCACTGKSADVWLVRYDPRVVQVAIQRGENGGRTLPHRNVVRELVRLGAWNGQAAHFAIPASRDPALSTAVLVQTGGAGPILAAAKG